MSRSSEDSRADGRRTEVRVDLGADGLEAAIRRLKPAVQALRREATRNLRFMSRPHKAKMKRLRAQRRRAVARQRPNPD